MSWRGSGRPDVSGRRSNPSSRSGATQTVTVRRCAGCITRIDSAHYRRYFGQPYLCHMQQPPHVANSAPNEPFLTGYDMAHLVTYLRLLDADAEGADLRGGAPLVLELRGAKGTKRDRGAQ